MRFRNVAIVTLGLFFNTLFFTQAVEEFKVPDVGSDIELELKDGRIIRGKCNKITSDKIYIGTTGVIVGYKQNEITSDSRCKFFKSAYDKKIADNILKLKKDEAEAAEQAKTMKKRDVGAENEARALYTFTAANSKKAEQGAPSVATDAPDKSAKDNTIDKAKIFSSKNELAQYFKKKVIQPYNFKNPHTGGINSVIGDIRSSDVKLYEENASVIISIVNSHNNTPVATFNFYITFVKNFGQWEVDEATHDHEYGLAWGNNYISYLIEDLGLKFNGNCKKMR